MDDMLGNSGLHQGDSIELAQELDAPGQVCFGRRVEGDDAGVLSGKCIQESGNEDPGACGALGGVEKFPQETLELLDWDGRGTEKFQAEVPGFFYLEGVDGHGESDGVKNHSNPSDYGGGALALVWGCIQSKL